MNNRDFDYVNVLEHFSTHVSETSQYRKELIGSAWSQLRLVTKELFKSAMPPLAGLLATVA